MSAATTSSVRESMRTSQTSISGAPFPNRSLEGTPPPERGGVRGTPCRDRGSAAAAPVQRLTVSQSPPTLSA